MDPAGWRLIAPVGRPGRLPGCGGAALAPPLCRPWVRVRLKTAEACGCGAARAEPWRTGRACLAAGRFRLARGARGGAGAAAGLLFSRAVRLRDWCPSETAAWPATASVPTAAGDSWRTRRPSPRHTLCCPPGAVSRTPGSCRRKWWPRQRTPLADELSCSLMTRTLTCSSDGAPHALLLCQG